MIRALSANGTFQPIYLSASTISRPRHRSALFHGSLFALREPSSQESTGPKISGQGHRDRTDVPTHECIGPKTDPGETARRVARSGSTEDSRPRSVMSAWTKTNPLISPRPPTPLRQICNRAVLSAPSRRFRFEPECQSYCDRFVRCPLAVESRLMTWRGWVPVTTSSHLPSPSPRRPVNAASPASSSWAEI